MRRREKKRCQGTTPSTGRQCKYPAFVEAFRWTLLNDYFVLHLPHAEIRCFTHLPTEEKDVVRAAEADYETRRDRARRAPPACWSWPVPSEALEMLRRSRFDATLRPAERARLFADALNLYDQGRCAVCGRQGNDVEDHDHSTGLTRGWLCRPCNITEGKYPGSVDDTWAMYRERYPYLILGIEEPYSGFGWKDGRPIGYGPCEWPLPPPDPANRWKDNAMRGAL